MPDSALASPADSLFFDNVRMGQFIDVELQNGLSSRFKSYLIGAKDHHYLIIEQPDIRRYGNMRDHLKEGLPIVVRTICEKTTGECLGFKAEIKGVCSHPVRMVVISFPEQVELRELRSEQRQSYQQPAQIFLNRNGDKTVGMVTDISSGGCRFEFHANAMIKGIKQDYVYIEMQQPGQSAPQQIYARVCSQRREQNRISVGLAFDAA